VRDTVTVEREQLADCEVFLLLNVRAPSAVNWAETRECMGSDAGLRQSGRQGGR